MARAFDGRVLLRIEDHDPVRSRTAYEAALLDDLAWLGFRPDLPVVHQRDRRVRYAEILDMLARNGLAYVCSCSRRGIEAQGDEPVNGERRYPGTCRSRNGDGIASAARRIRLEREEIRFRDLRLGDIVQVPADQAGDTLARDRNGNWTYQFAVVVDDADQGVDVVIRGEDLLASTGRQIQLGHLIGRKSPAAFLHHPLIRRNDGSKLSKSNRDTGVRDLRAAGWSKEKILGAAAHALGLGDGSAATLPDVASLIATEIL